MFLSSSSMSMRTYKNQGLLFFRYVRCQSDLIVVMIRGRRLQQ
jgi:hypothetical protein